VQQGKLGYFPGSVIDWTVGRDNPDGPLCTVQLTPPCYFLYSCPHNYSRDHNSKSDTNIKW